MSAWGHVCLAKKEFKESKKYFLQIENGKLDLLKDEAKIVLAMLHEADNNAVAKQLFHFHPPSGYNTSRIASITELGFSLGISCPLSTQICFEAG